MTVQRDVQARLARAGVRMTPGRRAVVEALAGAPGPLSAVELQEVVADRVPVSSLYRTLTVMESLDVVSTVRGPGGLARFELSESLKGHHHHLMCRRCGSVTDVAVDPSDEDRLEDLATGVAEDAGFTVMGHSLEIEGICRGCAS